jgi:hypothetical protein
MSHYAGHADASSSALGAGLFLGLGIYAIQTYRSLQGFSSDTNTEGAKCMAGTTLGLLLASGIVDIVSAILLLAAIICTLYNSISKQKGLDPGVKGKIASGIAYTITSVRLLGALAVFAITIAMSVFVWRDQCSSVFADASSNFFFQKMQTYLIIYWVLAFGCGCFIACVAIALAIIVGVLAARDI